MNKTNSLIHKIAIIICATLMLSAVTPTRFAIKGIKGETFKNVKTRLAELNKVKPLAQLNTNALQKQIEDAMSPFGYFNPQVTISQKKNILSIKIKKGPQTHYTKINIKITGEGSNDFEIQKSLSNLAIKPGQAFNNDEYDKAKESVINAAEHQGYLRAAYEKAELIIDKSQNISEVNWIINTGPLFYFGQVQFDPTYICPELLNRYVRFNYGQPFSTDKILKFNSDLSASGYFKSVTVKPQFNGERYVPINVHLQRINRINYTIGIGYGTDTGPRGRLGVQVAPVNRAGHKFNLVAQGSIKENALQAQYTIPGANPITDQFSLNAGVSNLNYNSGYGNAFLASVAQQKTLQNYQHVLSLNALTEQFHYNYQDKYKKSLAYPKAVLTFKKTTSQLFSPTGFNVSFSGLAASRAVLSDLSLSQGMVDAKVALTVDAIRTRFFAHTIQGLTNITDIYQLPISLAILLGGANDMKAYSYNSIGPGKKTTYGGFEIQKETVKDWYIVGFFDAGDVYNPIPINLQYGAGFALMWVSPVGPIKIGVAQAVNKRLNRVPNQSPRLVINMGPDL